METEADLKMRRSELLMNRMKDLGWPEIPDLTLSRLLIKRRQPRRYEIGKKYAEAFEVLRVELYIDNKFKI